MSLSSRTGARSSPVLLLITRPIISFISIFMITTRTCSAASCSFSFLHLDEKSSPKTLSPLFLGVPGTPKYTHIHTPHSFESFQIRDTIFSCLKSCYRQDHSSCCQNTSPLKHTHTFEKKWKRWGKVECLPGRACTRLTRSFSLCASGRTLNMLI